MMNGINSDKLKTLRHFATRIINVAAKDQKWNNQGLVDLFRLMSEELNFDSRSVLKCLKQMQTNATPKFLSSLLKKKVIQITLRDILDIMIEQANSMDELCHLIEENVHHETLDLTSKDALFELRHIITKVSMAETDVMYYQAFLCGQCPSKAAVGRLLFFFIGPPEEQTSTTSSMSTYYDHAKISAIYDIVTSPSFQQLNGSMQSFYNQFKQCETQLHALLAHSNMIDKLGNLREMDVDSDGDLRDLIASSCEESSAEEEAYLAATNQDSSSDSEDTDSTAVSRAFAAKRFKETRFIEKKSSSSSTSTEPPVSHRLKKMRKRKLAIESSEEDTASDSFVSYGGNKFSRITVNCFDEEAQESDASFP